jgi:endonuclease/exonuclease/phosphatase family metal-dependent hydrolase
MFENRRWMMLPLGLLAGLLALVLVLAGCGKTETTTPEPVSNPFVPAQVGTDSTLEVMTWNIEVFPKAGTTIDWVRQIIEGVRPDIVAVEEISNTVSFDALSAALGGWDGEHASSDAYQNLGFLYRVDGGLEVTSIYEIFASNDYSRPFPRAPYVLEANWNGTPIVVIGNHLKASGNGIMDPSDPWDEETRRRDACILLAEYIKTELVGKRVFVVGDMNDQLTDATANNVFQTFLDQPDTFRFADMAIALGPSEDWSYPTWPSHIDHILVTEPLFAALSGPAALTTVVPLGAYMPSGMGKYMTEVSDHLPVITRLQP